MRVKISADSTCDLSKDIIEKYDIGITPLYIVKGGESLRDGIDITPRDIFDYVESGAGVCSTAAVNPAEYIERFSGWLREYDAVVHVNISSEFSMCHQNAVLAGKELGNVYAVDSRNLSTGSGHLVMDAAILAEEGMEPAEIKAELERRARLIEASFMIDTLKYLHKGGRCGPVAALGANVLSLKPCIEVIGGKMDVGKKYRGNLRKCIARYVKDRLAGRDDLDRRRIFITHSGVDREIVDDVRRMVEDCGGFEEVIETVAGCAISNHCGPGTLGLMLSKKV